METKSDICVPILALATVYGHVKFATLMMPAEHFTNGRIEVKPCSESGILMLLQRTTSKLLGSVQSQRVHSKQNSGAPQFIVSSTFDLKIFNAVIHVKSMQKRTTIPLLSPLKETIILVQI